VRQQQAATAPGHFVRRHDLSVVGRGIPWIAKHGSKGDNDVEYWKQGLNELASVKPVKRGRCLSFFLESQEDFQFFQKSATSGLLKAAWSWCVDTEDSEDAEGDSEE